MAWNPVCEYDTITEHVENIERPNQCTPYVNNSKMKMNIMK